MSLFSCFSPLVSIPLSLSLAGTNSLIASLLPPSRFFFRSLQTQYVATLFSALKYCRQVLFCCTVLNTHSVCWEIILNSVVVAVVCPLSHFPFQSFVKGFYIWQYYFLFYSNCVVHFSERCRELISGGRDRPFFCLCSFSASQIKVGPICSCQNTCRSSN